MRNIGVVYSDSGYIEYSDDTHNISGLSLFNFGIESHDYIYAFDKITKVGTIFGEIQNDFSLSKVIDGTKDSGKMVVISKNETSVEPNTIIYHLKTKEWFIVSNDKVQRRLNDSGFMYTHELDLDGAIELLNARDLTDSGFYQDDYTLAEFIGRLFALSNFEYSLYQVNSDLNVDKVVNFVKTFENYTLLSALREILDAYNYCQKLTFNAYLVNDVPTILSFNLDLVPKTGLVVAPLDISHFTDVRETKTYNKNSFGSTVISNAENVISTINKTYPLIGSTKLNADNYLVTPSDAYLRLPSDVYKVNWLKIHLKLNIDINFGEMDGSGGYNFHVYNTVFPINNYSFNVLTNQLFSLLADSTYFPNQLIRSELTSLLENNIATLKESLLKASCVTLWGGNNFNPDTKKVVQGENTLYIPIFYNGTNPSDPHLEMTLVDKNIGSTLPTIEQGIWYERGSDKITHFDFLTSYNRVRLENTDLQSSETKIFEIISVIGIYGLKITINLANLMKITEISCSTNYIPMSDIKIKVDNQSDKNDIQIYNQNGKLTDSVALSKLINSYATEISSDTITRYKQYYDYNDVPKVGQVVLNGTTRYVINNISMQFTRNEDEDNFGYLIDCQVSMSKQYAVKSLMVSPNTNIRDYGIPQNFNVKRKQLYRDYYEFDYTSSGNVDTPYLSQVYTIQFPAYTQTNIDFVCFIKTTFSQAIDGGSDTYYYKLEPTRYDMNKTFYVVLDLKDNNIIGYDVQNVFSGFDLTRLISVMGLTNLQNTPISYVDSKGNVEDFEILYLTAEDVSYVYDNYYTAHISEPNIEYVDLTNAMTFISQELYEHGSDYSSMAITELHYKKDPIEVPVFEYSCQIGDSENVIIGDDLLRQHNNCVYFYTYEIGNNLTPTSVYDNQEIQELLNPTRIRINNGVLLTYTFSTNILSVSLKSKTTYDYTNITYGTGVNVQASKDLAVFRIAYDLTNGKTYRELMFIAKNVPTANIISGALRLYTNYWKLK